MKSQNDRPVSLGGPQPVSAVQVGLASVSPSSLMAKRMSRLFWKNQLIAWITLTGINCSAGRSAMPVLLVRPFLGRLA